MAFVSLLADDELLRLAAMGSKIEFYSTVMDESYSLQHIETA
jgi:hypothetical protein